MSRHTRGDGVEMWCLKLLFLYSEQSGGSEVVNGSLLMFLHTCPTYVRFIKYW